MYAQLCKRLSEEAPNFEPPNTPCTFRLLLLNKCKIEFDRRSELLAQYAAKDVSLEDEERRHLAKRKMLGNIKFIGELGKLEILSDAILHRCIQELLLTKKGEDPSEDLECLCQIMRTCGHSLDNEKGKRLMEQYFDRMAVLAENQELPPRIRFMLKDVIDLRVDGWAPRKVAVVEGPVPIHQIKPVEDDRPGYHQRQRMNERNNSHHHHHHGHHHGHDRDADRSPNVSELFRHPMKTRGGLDDMLIGMNLSSSTANLIPTHPFPTNGFGNQRDGSFRGHNNQRSGGGGGGGGGFNNFNHNNQRGQYKHNQNNNQSKELAPRFKKNYIVHHEQNISELELRPSANSMLFNKAAVKTNNLMNTKPPIEPLITTTTSNTTPKPPVVTPLHKEPIPIKQAPAEKPKQAKKEKGPNKDEVIKKFNNLIDEHLKGETTLEQALENYNEHKVPEKFIKDALLSGLKNVTLGKTNEEKQKFVELVDALKFSNNALHDSYKQLCNLIDECENEKDNVINSIALIFSVSIRQNLINIADIASITEHGAFYPLFLCTLQELKNVVGEKELSTLFNESKVTLLAQLPENYRTKEKLTEILEEKRLTFLCPMLRLEADLAKQLQVDPNPQQFYKWIKENLESIDFNEHGFITALMTVLLKYISKEAALEANGDDKAITEKERALLDRYQHILHAFLHDKPKLQLVAIYALQVHFYSLGFPRGQILRWFNALYDLSIVEEEVFLTWKEDVTDVYPGKGQALFQVNNWLTWLQEAESEEEEGDE